MNDKESLPREIVQILSTQIGKDNAIPRDELLNRLLMLGIPVSDRQMREAIETARATEYKGAWICSSLDGKGYYMAATGDELMEYANTEMNRARSIYQRVNQQVKRALPHLSGQFTLQEG